MSDAILGLWYSDITTNNILVFIKHIILKLVRIKYSKYFYKNLWRTLFRLKIWKTGPFIIWGCLKQSIHHHTKKNQNCERQYAYRKQSISRSDNNPIYRRRHFLLRNYTEHAVQYTRNKWYLTAYELWRCMFVIVASKMSQSHWWWNPWWS